MFIRCTVTNRAREVDFVMLHVYTFNSACNSISYHILYMSYPVTETLIIRRCECVDYCMYDL